MRRSSFGGAGASVGGSGGLAAWAGSTAVAADVLRVAPDGSLIVSLSARTTRASYDATEAANWSTLGVDTTTLDAAIAAKADTSYVDDQIDALLVLLDDVPPSVPASVASTAPSGLAIDVTWDASTDNIGVTGYEVWRDDAGAGYLLVGTPSVNSYSDAGLAPSTTFTYKIKAVDAAGNKSAFSATTAKTTGSGVPTKPTTGLVHDWSADDLATADDATVAAWVDSVGAASMTAGGTPKMRFAEMNGHKVVEYGGAAGSAKHDSGTLTTRTQTLKLVAGKMTNTPGVGVTWAICDQTGTNVLHRQRLLTSLATGSSADAGTVVSNGLTPNTSPHIWAGIFQGNTGSGGPSGVRRDATRTKGSVGTGDTQTNRLGQSGSSTQTDIMIARELIYDISGMSAGDVDTLLDAAMAYLGYTYGVTVS